MRLLDSHAESFLKENGFCKFDLKAKSILSQLKEIYKKHILEPENKQMFVTHNDGQVEKTTRIHHEIAQVFEPILFQFWEDYEIYAAHFVVKKAKSEESFQLHQDWSNVEETIERSVQIWLPLDLSYPENGGMGFIPKSHLFFNNYRSGSYSIPRVEVEEKLYPYISYTRLFPGEANFFYTSTFHCSFINSTDEDRVAVLLNIIPKNQQTLYFHKNGDEVEKYKMSTRQLYERLHLLEKGEAPAGLDLVEKIENVQDDNVQIDANTLIHHLTKENSKRGLPADYELKMYSVIRDENLEKEINHRGYKVIDFLTEKERNEILKLFPKFFPDRTIFKGRYSSMDHLPAEKTLEVHQEIQKIIRPRIEHFFKDAYSPISILYSKKPDGVLDIDWHSDPSFLLNEQLEPLYGIWCALYDIGEKEGSLMVVPGSHRFIKRLNGTSVTWQTPLSELLRELDQYGIQPPLKAGQAILYDTRIIHNSTPNHSSIDRDCTVMRITHDRTQDFFHILMDKENSNKGFVHRNTSDFFFGNTAKHHQGEIEYKNLEGEMYFFDYPMTKEIIKQYFNRF
ncbi:MAG: phytanoyl-CoA dioxygenase family protein [Chitinophagales bacterium]|nr:phytanoyl-CoA dioxygenase family protein [Chitinophagales bacterium]